MIGTTHERLTALEERVSRLELFNTPLGPNTDTWEKREKEQEEALAFLLEKAGGGF